MNFVQVMALYIVSQILRTVLDSYAFFSGMWWT